MSDCHGWSRRTFMMAAESLVAVSYGVALVARILVPQYRHNQEKTMTSPKLLCVTVITLAIAIGALISFTGVVGAQANPAMILMRDACDPTTFNAALGPGHCVGDPVTPPKHPITPFGFFIAELTSDRIAGAWRFNPLLNASGGAYELVTLNLTAGQQTMIQNLGGEIHTFTRVKEFGGGQKPRLNTLSGNPIPAPECALGLSESDTNVIVEAGTSQAGPTAGTSALPEEVTKWQCCIHPWMRMLVTVSQGQP